MTFSAPTETLLPGAQLGRYTITALLGQGSMGAVYAAHDPQLDRRVAIKVLRPDRSAANQDELRAQRLREAQAMSRLGHPNVIAIYDVAVAGQEVLIAMELIEGATLRRWSAERSWRELLGAYLQAGRGLEAAHAAGVNHRHFKPDNVLVAHDGRVLVTDFGLTREPPGGGDLFAFCQSLEEALEGVRLGKRPPDSLLREVRRGLDPEPSKRPASMTQLLASLEPAKAPERSRGLIPALLIVLLVVTSTIALVRVRMGPRLACAEATQRIELAWNASRKQQIGDAFLKTRLAYAADALARVTAAFDRFAGAWATEFAASCAQSVERPEVSELYSRMACLSEQLAEVQTKSDLLARADDKLVEDAAAMAASLEDPSLCARGLALTAPPPPQSLRPVVERIRADFAKIKSLGELGRFDEALPLATKAVADARAIPFRPVQAEALFTLATISHESYDATSALAQARDAALLAEGSRHDAVAARAWILALQISAGHLANPAEALALVGHARAAIERVGGDEALTAQVENATGVILMHEGKAEDSLAAQRSAWAHYSKTGREDQFAAWLLNDQGAVLEELRRYEEALEQFRLGYELKLRLLGPHHPDVGISLSNLGTIETSLGRFAEAEKHLAQTREIFRAALPPDHYLFLPLEVNEGDLALRRGEPARAIEHYQLGLTVGAKHYKPDYDILRLAMLGLGRAQLAVGNADAAVDVLTKALPADETSLDRVVLGDVKFALAEALVAARGDSARARELWTQARASYLAAGPAGAHALAELDVLRRGWK